MQLTVYSLILMAVILWRPTGLMGVLSDAYARVLPPAGRTRAKLPSMAEALVVRGLSKRFGGLRAVQDLAFRSRKTKPSP